MKKWDAAEIVELNIAETANGHINGIVEFSHKGYGYNNDMFDGNDSNGDGIFKGSDKKGEDDTTDEVVNPLS